jgi:hypothetical protein
VSLPEAHADEPRHQDVEGDQRPVEQRQVGALTRIDEDRDQESDRLEDHHRSRDPVDPAHPGEPAANVTNEL